MYYILFNQKTRNVLEVENEEEVKRYEKMGFKIVWYRGDYDTFDYKIIYCRYHKRYEIYYHIYNKYLDYAKKMTKLALKIANLIKDCRFFRNVYIAKYFQKLYPYIQNEFYFSDNESVFLGIFVDSLIVNSLTSNVEEIEIERRFFNKLYKIIRELYKLDKKFVYFFIKYYIFKVKIFEYLKENNFTVKDVNDIEEILDDTILYYIDNNRKYYLLGYLIVDFYCIKEMFANDKLIKKYLRVIEKLIYKKFDMFIDDVFNSNNRVGFAELTYKITNDTKFLKYLL